MQNGLLTFRNIPRLNRCLLSRALDVDVVMSPKIR